MPKIEVQDGVLEDIAAEILLNIAFYQRVLWTACRQGYHLTLSLKLSFARHGDQTPEASQIIPILGLRYPPLIFYSELLGQR